MRIAFLLDTFPQISETFIIRQITGLIDSGHEVDIYSANRPYPSSITHKEVSEYDLISRTTYLDSVIPPEAGYWEMPVLPITETTWIPGTAESIPNWLRVVRAVPDFMKCLVHEPRLTFSTLNPHEYHGNAISLGALYRLSAILSISKHYDILHAHFGPVGNNFRFARNILRAPLVVTFHGYDFCTFPRMQGADVYDKLFETADLITVNSNYAYARVAALGCPESRLRRLPVGVNLPDIQFRTRSAETGETIRFLSVARLVAIKGHEFAIRAFARVHERIPNVHLDIVGDGPLRHSLEVLADELGVGNAITFHGALDNVAILRLYEVSHLFLLTSVTIDGDQEAQGLVLQEAQAAGIPVIATSSGGIAEGIGEGAGYLVGEWDIDMLTERMVFLASRPEVWMSMGIAGRRFVEKKFSMTELTQELLDIYCEAKVRYESEVLATALQVG
jgi:colanic acid/amylovoran biosynthesis glycosyltransferase